MPNVDPSRRSMLGRVVMATLGLSAMMVGVASAQVPKTSKADVKYQFTPKGADHCASCVSFIPDPAGGGGPGLCRAVEGPIPQNGWCVLFSKRA